MSREPPASTPPEDHKPDPTSDSRQLAEKLVIACSQGEVETVRSLLEEKAEVGCSAPGNARTRGGLQVGGAWTPLHAAIDAQAVDVVRMLLEVQADVESKLKLRYTRRKRGQGSSWLPIHCAAVCGNGPVLRALVSARADVNDASSDCFERPLHWAAENGHIEIAVILAELKADVNAGAAGGWTALHFAAFNGNADNIETLLAVRIDPKSKDDDGHSALKIAMRGGHADAAKSLLTAGHLDVEREELVPHCWAALINRGDCLATAIHGKTAPVDLRESVVLKRLRATFCAVTPKTLLLEAPEEMDWRGVANTLLIPTSKEALPFWSRLTRPSVTSKGRLIQLHLGCDPTHQAIIRAFANTPNEAAHALPVATALLEHAWGGVEAWYYCEVLWCYSVLACTCIVAKHLNQEREAPHRELAVMLAGIAKRVMDEVAQLLDMAIENLWSFEAPATLCGEIPEPVSKCRALAYATFWHFTSPMNQVDIGCLILDTAAVIAAFNFRGTQWQTGLIGASGAAMWLRALYSLRGFRKFGTGLLPILSAVKDTLTFFVVMAFVFAAVTHFYYLTHGAGTELFPAFEKVYKLCLWADFDIVDWQGLSPSYVMVNGTDNGLQWVPEDPPHTDMYPLLQYLFYTTTICVTVIFMNLLIAILNENFSEYETRSAALFQRERANLIVMLRCSTARLTLVLLRRGLELLAGRARAATMQGATEKAGSAGTPDNEGGLGPWFMLGSYILPSGMMRYHYKYWDTDTKPKLVFLEKVEEGGEGDTTGEIRSTRFYLNQQITATEKRLNQQLNQVATSLKAIQDKLVAR